MSKKLQNLKEQHAIEEHQLRIGEFTEQQKEETLLFVGKLQAVSVIAKALNSQEVRALELFQQEGRYRHLGFDNFVEFLNSDYSKVTKNQYYDRIKLLEAEGDSRFDLMNEVGVSLSTRKLLAAGNYEAITIDGDTLKIGEETADLSNVRLVRTLIESYANDLKRLSGENATKQKKIETFESQIEEGAKQLETLRRQVDQKGQTEYGAIFTTTILKLSEFVKFVGKLSDAEKQEFAETALGTISVQFGLLSKAFGVNRSLTANPETGIDPLVEKVMADGFDDE